MKRHINFLLSILFLVFFAGCTECEEPYYLVDGSTFAFGIIDEPTNENLFPNHADPFIFQIIDDNGDTVDIDNRRDGGASNYGFILDPTGEQSFRYGQRLRRTYYLQFDSLDTDTLSLIFIPRQDDCDEHIDNFEVYYNDELVFTGSGKCCYETDFIKK